MSSTFSNDQNDKKTAPMGLDGAADSKQVAEGGDKKGNGKRDTKKETPPAKPVDPPKFSSHFKGHSKTPMKPKSQQNFSTSTSATSTSPISTSLGGGGRFARNGNNLSTLRGYNEERRSDDDEDHAVDSSGGRISAENLGYQRPTSARFARNANQLTTLSKANGKRRSGDVENHGVDSSRGRISAEPPSRTLELLRGSMFETGRAPPPPLLRLKEPETPLPELEELPPSRSRAGAGTEKGSETEKESAK